MVAGILTAGGDDGGRVRDRGGFFFALPGTNDPDRPLGADLFA